MMNQTNNQKEIVNKGVNWQEAIETSKEVLGGLSLEMTCIFILIECLG